MAPEPMGVTYKITIKPINVTNLKAIVTSTSSTGINRTFYEQDMTKTTDSYKITYEGIAPGGVIDPYSITVSADGYKTITLENQTSGSLNIVLEPLSIEEIQLNGTIYKIKDSFHQVVSELPTNPDPNVFYYIVEN